MDKAATEGESTDDGFTDKGFTDVLIDGWLTDADEGMIDRLTGDWPLDDTEEDKWTLQMADENCEQEPFERKRMNRGPVYVEVFPKFEIVSPHW